jgi:glyoxylase-like metal-dependent hydrolase (beta-lactamase superfamily II)
LPQPRVICLTNGVYQENCYILADPETDDAVIIDPGEDSDLFLRRMETEGFTLRAVWLTHAHLDHILGVKDVVERSGAPLHMHPADRPLYDGIAEQGAWLGVQAPQPPAPDHELAHGDALQLGGLEFEVRHVPGHSPGSVAFVGHGVAIVGDAIFAGSVGRVDLPGGDGGTLLASIRDQLMTLPDETIVYSVHGPETTVGAERRTNPFVTGAIPLV